MDWLSLEDEEYAKKLSQEMENRKQMESKKIDRWYEKYKRSLGDGNNKKAAEIESEMREIGRNYATLKNGISELNEMGTTQEQTFTYVFGEGIHGSTGINENGIIVMNIGGGNLALGAHESSHGYDIYKNGGMPQNTVSGIYPGEIKAYSIQYSLGGSLVMPKSDYGNVRSINDISSYLWISGINGANGAYIYPMQISGVKYPYIQELLKREILKGRKLR
jgi:hypothetical protein